MSLEGQNYYNHNFFKKRLKMKSSTRNIVFLSPKPRRDFYDVQGLKSMHYDMLTLKENLSITIVHLMCYLCTIVGPRTCLVCLQMSVPFNDFNYIQNFTLQFF